METATSKKNLDTGRADSALCRATLYQALALGFLAPNQETTDRLLSAENVDILVRAAKMADETGTVADGILRMAASKERLPASLASAYQRIFGHTARGIVSLHETEYGDEAPFQQPQEMGDLAGFYRAFGLKLNAARHERLDHISCQCEFMLFLALKEAYALEHDDPATLEETRKAGRLFLRDHLGRFGPTFARRVAREDEGGFYGALGDVCFAFLTHECDRVGVSAGPVDMGLRPVTDDHVPMGCGSGCAATPGACGPEESEG